MSTNLGATVSRTLAVPVLMLIALAVALSAWIAHLTRAEVWVQHTYEVMGMVNQTERFLIDQETGLRGYLLSADPRFLQPYDSGRIGFARNLDQLSHLTEDNTLQQRRIAAVRESYHHWLTNAEAEKASIVTERGASFVARMAVRKEEMDGMRATFDGIGNEERHLLTQRAEMARRASSTLLYAGVALVVLCGILVVVFLRGQLREIDRIYIAKVEESDRARHAAEAMAAEIHEQAAAMEMSVRDANRQRDDAVRKLSGTPQS